MFVKSVDNDANVFTKTHFTTLNVDSLWLGERYGNMTDDYIDVDEEYRSDSTNDRKISGSSWNYSSCSCNPSGMYLIDDGGNRKQSGTPHRKSQSGDRFSILFMTY